MHDVGASKESNAKYRRCPDQTADFSSWVGGGRNLGGRLSLALGRGAQSEKPAFARETHSFESTPTARSRLIMPQVRWVRASILRSP